VRAPGRRCKAVVLELMSLAYGSQSFVCTSAYIFVYTWASNSSRTPTRGERPRRQEEAGHSGTIHEREEMEIERERERERE
jgi:hypothetical protein